MKGDTKSDELLKRLLLKPNVLETIQGIRTKYGIPNNGFKTPEEHDDWLRQVKTGGRDFIEDDSAILAVYRNFADELVAILKAHRLPSTLLSRLEHYVVCNDSFDMIGSNFACAIENPTHTEVPTLSIEQYWNYRSVKYTRLLIHEFASKKDVKDFIDKNWNQIQHSIKPGRKDAPRIRKRPMADEHALVYELYLKIKNGEVPRDDGYVEVQISSLLQAQYGVQIDSDNVRKIISTERKRRK